MKKTVDSAARVADPERNARAIARLRVRWQEADAARAEMVAYLRRLYTPKTPNTE